MILYQYNILQKRIIITVRKDRYIMDKIDIKLITLLQKNARFSLKELAEQVFLSSPAVSSRLEKLERQGYITGYQVAIDNERLGYPITAFISLEINPKQKPTFYPFISK